jgi:hypothetical protein
MFNVTHFLGKAFVSFQYQHYSEHLLQKYQEDHSFLKYGDNSLNISRAAKP